MGGTCHLSPSHRGGEGAGVGPISLTLLGVGAVVGGRRLSWTILPNPAVICLTPTMKSLVLAICVVGILGGVVINKFYAGTKVRAPTSGLEFMRGM